jgi:polar amino acid transport system substrate-binding protein
MITRILSLFIAFSTLVSLSLPLVAAECTLVKYNSHQNYPPFHWYHDGRFYGVTHDITKKLLATYGIDFQVQYPEPWKRVLLNAKRGNSDLVLGLKNVLERQAYLSFTSAPVLNNPVAVFVKRDKVFDLQGWHSLIGKTGNMNLGDRHGNEFDSFANEHLNIQRVNGLAANFDMLKMERADYFVTGYYTGQAYLQAQGLERDIIALKPHLLDGLIHFGFVKNSPCIVLKTRFDQDLLSLVNSPEFEQIMQHNLALWQQQQQSTALRMIE